MRASERHLPDSQEFHQIRLRHDAGHVALRGHQDRVVMSQQARRELHRGLPVDLRECRLHDLVDANPCEILRVPAAEDQIVDDLVRNRTDGMAVVHDRHLRELPPAHLVDRGGERNSGLDVLDLPRLDLVHERSLLMPFHLRLEGVHDPPDGIVRGIHLLLLDLHDRRLTDVREACDRRLRETECLAKARNLLEVRHHRAGQRERDTYSYRNFGINCLLLANRALRRGSNRFVEASNAERRSDKSHISKGASTAHIRRRPSVARNIVVEELIHTPIEQQHVEIVGGQSAPTFGGGVFLEPAYILLVGRATTMVNGERLPYRTAAIQAAHDYLEKTCTNLNVDADVILDCRIGQGSVDLRGLYDTQKALANDTSFGVGFAPFSELETLVLETEHLINGPMKRDLKEIGQDIKVMGVRQKDSMRLTIAAALVDRYVADKDHYRSAVDELRERVLDNAVKYTDREVKVDINTGDNYDTGIFYLTVTGLSWENGDDGSVGRGNRVSGLITPYRPMSMEAAAGKNPVTHVGKLYNLLSFDIAERLVKEHQGKVKEVWVRIVSQIGKPIDEPQAAAAQMIPEEGTRGSSIQKDAEALIDEELENIYKLTDRIVQGKARTF